MLAIVLLGLLAQLPQPRLTNAQASSHSLIGDLASAVRSLAAYKTPLWIGYAVPATDADAACCFGSGPAAGKRRCGGCQLEGRAGIAYGAPAPTVRLEAAATASILLRVGAGEVNRVAVYSSDCELDAGGLPFHWLLGVPPAESLALLATLVGAEPDPDDVLAAIAIHSDAGAAALLERLARHAAKPGVRGQALFWMARRASRGAAAEITRAIAQDPETEVKRKAVFALSELPDGVPLLIDLARTNRNPVVREQAFFWLGESEDPRALEFLAGVLRTPPR